MFLIIFFNVCFHRVFQLSIANVGIYELQREVCMMRLYIVYTITWYFPTWGHGLPSVREALKGGLRLVYEG